MPISSYRVSFHTKEKSSLRVLFWNSVDTDDIQVVIQVTPGSVRKLLFSALCYTSRIVCSTDTGTYPGHSHFEGGEITGIKHQ